MSKTPGPPQPGTLRIFIPIAPDDPFYAKFAENWKRASEAGESGVSFENGPAIRELVVDLTSMQRQVDLAIREIVKMRLDALHAERAIEVGLQKKIETAIHQAIDQAGASAVATARAMLQQKVSEEIAARYEIEVDVRVKERSRV